MALTRPRYSTIIDTDWKTSVRVATVGASITLSGSAPNTLDGVTLALNDRILVKDQGTPSQNGIYRVATLGSGSNGTWVRAYDANAAISVTSGQIVPVTEGTLNGGHIFLLSTPDPITLDSTSLTYVSAGFNSAGINSITNSTVSTSTTTGALTVSGGVGIAGNIYAGGNANITSNANVGGNVNVIGNILSPSHQNGNSSVNIAANANVTITAKSNATVVISDTGANITGTANISGNANVGNLGTLGLITASGNVTGGNLVATNNLQVSGNKIKSSTGNTAITLSDIDVTVEGNLTVQGITTTLNTTTLDVKDLNITVAKGAASAAAANGAGLTVDGASATLLYINSSNTWTFDRGLTVNGIANITGNANIGNVGTGTVIASAANVSGNANVGNLTTAGQVVSTKTGDTADGNSQIYLNGATLNRIDFNTSGTAAPAFTTRSAGSKIVLYPSTTGSATDYAIGINSATLWQSLPQNDAGMFFRWYGGTTEIANLSGTGVLTVSGNANVGNLGTAQVLASANITSPQLISNIATGTAPLVVTSTTQIANINVATAGNLVNGTSNVVVTSSGNITVGSGGNAAIFTVTSTGANVSGYLNIAEGTITAQQPILTKSVTWNNSSVTFTALSTSITDTASAGGSLIADWQVGGATKFSINKAGNTTVAGTLNVTGNANVGNLGAGSGTITTTGNLLGGNLTVTANANVANLNYTGGVYENGNQRYPVRYTASTAPHASPTLGDWWYDTGSDKVYLRITDGTTPSWLDTTSKPPSLVAGTSNVVVTSNGNVVMGVAGNAQIFTVTGTGANVSGTLNVTANLSGGNLITAGYVSATGNITSTAGKFIGDGGLLTNISASGGTSIVNGNSNVIVGANSNVSISAIGNANVLVVTGVGANISGTLGVTGNITGNYILGNGSQLTGIITTVSNVINGTSNINISSSGSNVTVGVAGNANVLVVTGTGANITGTANVSGNANVGNLGTSGNITAGYFLGNGSQLTGITTTSTSLINGNSNVVVIANANVTISSNGTANVMVITNTGANVAGTANITGNILAGANIVYTGNLYQGAQLRYAHAYTASTAAPSGSTVGDYWYDTATDILYLRVSDGTTPLWFDVSSQANTFSDTTTTNATITTASITTANISGNINAANLQNGTSNLRIVASGNVTVSATGTANVVVVTSTGANIAGTANITGATNIGSTLGVTTSVTSAQFIANGAVGQFTVRRRDTGVDSWAIYSGAGSLSYYDAVGATDRLHLSAAGILYPNGNGTQQLGLTTNRWSNIWGLASSAQYADLAERYSSDYDYSPGTVVIFGGNAEITVTNKDHDPRIAGVISTNPGYLMNDNADQDALMLPVALTGRVPTRVRGPISKGDMVVSSTEEGIAIRMSKALYEPGCVIGKSLENIDDDSIQTIEVVVGRL